MTRRHRRSLPTGRRSHTSPTAGSGQRIFVASAAGRGSPATRERPSLRRLRPRVVAGRPPTRASSAYRRVRNAIPLHGERRRNRACASCSRATSPSPTGRRTGARSPSTSAGTSSSSARTERGRDSSPARARARRGRPDGRAIAFSSDRDDEDDEGGDSDIFVVSTSRRACEAADGQRRRGPVARLVSGRTSSWRSPEATSTTSRARSTSCAPTGAASAAIRLQTPSAMPSWQPLP